MAIRIDSQGDKVSRVSHLHSVWMTEREVKIPIKINRQGDKLVF